MGGLGQRWWVNDYEYSFVEVLMLIMLVFVALGFETLWHHALRQSEHSYQYGTLRFSVEGAGDRKPVDVVKHLQLPAELMNRAGGEFMTLGFLAFCVFLFNNAGGFEWVSSRFPPTHDYVLPQTGVEWFHMVENVHMQLFIGMVFYFLLISAAVRGSTAKIKVWEELHVQGLKVPAFRGTLSSSSRLRDLDSSVADYFVWRDYFNSKMSRWQRKCPAVFTELLKKLHLDPLDETASDQFLQVLEQDFVFSAYLALNVEGGVRDSIQINPVTWGAMLCLFGFFAVLHHYVRVDFMTLMPGFSAGAVAILMFMHIFIVFKRTSITRKLRESTGTTTSEMASTATPTLVGQSSHSSVKLTSPLRALSLLNLRLNERVQTEIVMLRLLQVLLFLVSYVSARTLLDFVGWEEHPITELIYTGVLACIVLALAYSLPSSVPVFLAIMAMPPYVDGGNFGNFCAVLLESKAQAEERELRAAARELIRSPTDSSPNGTPRQGRASRALLNLSPGLTRTLMETVMKLDHPEHDGPVPRERPSTHSRHSRRSGGAAAGGAVEFDLEAMSGLGSDDEGGGPPVPSERPDFQKALRHRLRSLETFVLAETRRIQDWASKGESGGGPYRPAVVVSATPLEAEPEEEAALLPEQRAGAAPRLPRAPPTPHGAEEHEPPTEPPPAPDSARWRPPAR